MRFPAHQIENHEQLEEQGWMLRHFGYRVTSAIQIGTIFAAVAALSYCTFGGTDENAEPSALPVEHTQP